MGEPPTTFLHEILEKSNLSTAEHAKKIQRFRRL